MVYENHSTSDQNHFWTPHLSLHLTRKWNCSSRFVIHICLPLLSSFALLSLAGTSIEWNLSIVIGSYIYLVSSSAQTIINFCESWVMIHESTLNNKNLFFPTAPSQNKSIPGFWESESESTQHLSPPPLLYLFMHVKWSGNAALVSGEKQILPSFWKHTHQWLNSIHFFQQDWHACDEKFCTELCVSFLSRGAHLSFCMFELEGIALIAQRRFMATKIERKEGYE